MRISGGTVFGVTLLLAIAGLVFFFEFILAGVAFNGHINVTWVEREVFLEAYGIDAAAAAGIRAVIQPGGSMRDAEVIAAADEHDMAMLFTGIRHFRH